MVYAFISATGAFADFGLHWERLYDLPDAAGFAGHFAGVHGDHLIVAGGSNFPQAPLWEDGSKIWHDRIFVLADPDSEWIEAGRLPRRLASGVSISTDEGVLCIGGGDKERNYAETFLLQWRNKCISIVDFPPLPLPLASAAGARVGDTVYIAGGQINPADSKASKSFFSLDLAAPEKAWRELKTWPGPERMLAVAAADDESFYLISGLQLREGDTQEERLNYLRDAYVYRPDEGWKRLPDLPNAAVGAASPSVCLTPGRPLVIGGVDGKQLGLDPRRHPGLPNGILEFDPGAGEWRDVGRTPASRVVLPAIEWGGALVLASGELSPGVRSPQVWSLSVFELGL